MCWKYHKGWNHRWAWTAIVHHWWKHNELEPGHAYLCGRCGYWHWTGARRGSKLIRKPNPTLLSHKHERRKLVALPVMRSRVMGARRDAQVRA